MEPSFSLATKPQFFPWKQGSAIPPHKAEAPWRHSTNRNCNHERGFVILEGSHRLPRRPGPSPSRTAHPCTVPPAWSRHSRSSWEISVASSLNIDGPWNTKQFTKWPWAEFITGPEMKTVKRIGFDLRECPELSSKIIFYPVLFLNVFSNSEERG